MRLAILIALSADRRTARALGDPMPYDAAIKSLRDITPESAAGPIVQVWAGNAAKEKIFRGVPSLESPVPPSDELTAVLAANEQMQAQLAELQGKLDACIAANGEAVAANESLRAELQAVRESAQADKSAADAAAQRIAELESQLAEKAAKKK